jgi:glycosyltransferase involved in cell wall biosynthesis
MSSISYLITIYNKAECLPKLIEGLQNQQGEFEREFIFVDDGSRDDSLELLKTLTSNMRNVSIISQENKGPSVAVNTGLKIAKCDWIFLVDGDDCLQPDASQTLLSIAKNYPKAVVLKGQHSNSGELDYEKFDGTNVVYIEDAMPLALKFYPIGASTSMINRCAAQEVGGCDERVFIQDYSIALRMATRGGFIEINKIVACNINLDQVRLSVDKKRENYCTALARYLFVLDHPNLPKYYRYRALQFHLRKAWLWHLKRQRPLKFKHFYRYIISRFNFKHFSDDKISQWMSQALEVYN